MTRPNFRKDGGDGLNLNSILLVIVLGLEGWNLSTTHDNVVEQGKTTAIVMDLKEDMSRRVTELEHTVFKRP